MRRLMLLRHAKTETDSASGRDIDRRLDNRGLADARDTSRWLSEQSVRPDRVLVSPATRARQTWDIVAEALSPSPAAQEVEALYAASVAQLLDAIHRHGGNAATLMLVAHNPGLHELALSLIETNTSQSLRALQENFPTSAVAIIDFDLENWKDVHFQSGRLADLVTPKTLRSSAREEQ